MIPVNEVFETIQGEAFFTGTPAVFVRLQGCAVGCPWCDTKHTWELRPEAEIPVEQMFDKIDDAQTFAIVDDDELALQIATRFSSMHVVITGGEPCQYDLGRLSSALIAAGYEVQVETSGTEEIRIHPRAWVTLSPKYGMPGGKGILRSAFDRANEIKLPVGSPRDIARFETETAMMPIHPGKVWLQPLSQSEKATGLCILAARDRGWRVSLQTHKFINAR